MGDSPKGRGRTESDGSAMELTSLSEPSPFLSSGIQCVSWIPGPLTAPGFLFILQSSCFLSSHFRLGMLKAD